MAERNNPRQKKLEAYRLFRKRYDSSTRELLMKVDPRLPEYFDSINRQSGYPDGNPDYHNYYEVLGAAKFLRIFTNYPFDSQKVRQVIYLREGKWHKEGKRWVHDSDGIPQPVSGSTAASTVYRWEPFQVFILASVFGPHVNINTHAEAGSRDLLPSEYELDGWIYDSRRLCTDFTFYAARKNDKTGMAAYIQVVFFLMEDANAEIYCCANAEDQSKILFDRTRSMLRVLDPKGTRIRQTATICDWRPAFRHIRSSKIQPLTAGGKTKDGLLAQLCCADEYGSSPWIKGKSGMKQLVDVVESSMGPRREPLTFTTTTAGTIDSGPFVEKLAGLHLLLEDEVAFDDAQRRPANDRTLCLLLEPDAWERDEQIMLTSLQLRRKVCPMLGKVVQHSYYDDWVQKVRIEPTKMSEFVTKNMNVYKSATAQEWISPEDIRRLQDDRRVDACTFDNGWLTFVGMDFSLGDDLHALSYLSFNTQTLEFFADMDAWITEKTLLESAMREVFYKWIQQGWLRVSPGQTLQPELPISRIAELTDAGVNISMFLYDPYKAQQPINALNAFVYSLGVDPKDVIMPCRQNYATFNPLVEEFDFMVKNDPPRIAFSRNPMWLWEAGNMVLDTSTDGMENRKPRKRDSGSKIDNFIALLEALKGFDIRDGQIPTDK